MLTKRRASCSSPLGCDLDDETKRIKQERIDTNSSHEDESIRSSGKRSRAVADAESNTTHSGEWFFFFASLFSKLFKCPVKNKCKHISPLDDGFFSHIFFLFC